MNDTYQESGQIDQSKNRYHLTFDIDWAPDFCVAQILDLLNFHKIKSTFFITHPSDIVSNLAQGGHHVGIHPNFLPDSSHGRSVEDAIEYLLKIVPDATSMRTHCLVQSTPLLVEIFKKFPQLKYDFSIFMYRFPLVQPFNWSLNGFNCIRINYNWEDSAAFFDQNFDWATLKFYGPTTIFNFHPIHIGLNSRNETTYGALKKSMSGKPLWTATEEQVKGAANIGTGAFSFLNTLIKSSAQAIGFEELLEPISKLPDGRASSIFDK